MQGGHHGYGYDAGEYSSSASAGGYVYDAAAYYYSNGYDFSAYNGYDHPLATAGRSAHGFPAPPLDGVELQTSEACPRNYVIFDETRAGSSLTFHPTLAPKLVGQEDDGCSPAREKEDSEEIDALLQSSSEDDDVTSTCSSAAAGGSPRKKERIKKMMRALKGIVPGGKQMDTPAVLDEAVWYLKSLKLEAATNNKHGGARGGSLDS